MTKAALVLALCLIALSLSLTLHLQQGVIPPDDVAMTKDLQQVLADQGILPEPPQDPPGTILDKIQSITLPDCRDAMAHLFIHTTSAVPSVLAPRLSEMSQGDPFQTTIFYLNGKTPANSNLERRLSRQKLAFFALFAGVMPRHFRHTIVVFSPQRCRNIALPDFTAFWYPGAKEHTPP